MAAQSQVGFEPGLEQGGAQFRPVPSLIGRRRSRHSGQRLAPPQCQRFTEQRAFPLEIFGGPGIFGGSGESLGPEGIDGFGCDAQFVPVADRDQHRGRRPPGPVWFDELAHQQRVRAQRPDRIPGQLFTPHRVHELRRGQWPATGEQQRGQDGLRPRPARGQGLFATPNRDMAQHCDIQLRGIHRPLSGEQGITRSYVSEKSESLGP
ncbi:hypothetical protein GCM10027167_65960 [Nocardia heshunensis]